MFQARLNISFNLYKARNQQDEIYIIYISIVQVG